MIGTRRNRAIGAVGAAALLVTALAGQTLGTPGSGVISAAVLARADFTERVDVKFKIATDHGLHVANAPAAGEVVMQEIVLAPGGQTGWHSHPGPAIVLIDSGSFTVTDVGKHGCTSTTYVAGEAFIDPGQGHVHRGVNPSSTDNVVVYVAYLDVPSGTSPRIDAGDPGC